MTKKTKDEQKGEPPVDLDTWNAILLDLDASVEPAKIATHLELTLEQVGAAIAFYQDEKRAMQALRESRSVKLGDRESVEWTPSGVDFVHEFEGGGEARRRVFDGHFEPKARLVVDDEEYYRVGLDREIIARADGLMKRFRSEGKILYRSHAEDAIFALLRDFTKDNIERGHGALGVYASASGALELCLEPMPFLEERLQAVKECANAIAYVDKIAKEDADAYFVFIDRFHRYETLPTMGLAAISTCALVLRERNVLVPSPYHWSAESDLGKSKVALAFSEKLYGRVSIGGKTIASDYRMSAMYDAAGTTFAVEESADLDERKFGQGIKNRAERADAGRRGTPELGMVRYMSRGVPIFTANSLAFRSKPILKRLLAPRFDGSKRSERGRDAKDFDELYESLHPIGWGLARHVVETYRTIDALLAEITRCVAGLRRAHTFEDPSRATSYAVVFVGLELWDSYAKSLGTTWKKFPSIQEFVDFVVLPVEASTFEAADLPILAFSRWWSRWRALNVDAKTGEPKGFDVLWKPADVKQDEERIDGTWVTGEIVDIYNREALPDLRISSIADLARSSADFFLIDRELVTDVSKNAGKVERFGSGTKRCAFIPLDETPRGGAK